ncbi:MAG: radical SAM protein, partial [Bacteroidia bacterium]
KINHFETVLNGYYPTVSDVRLNNWQRSLIHNLSSVRYRMKLYKYPYEIKLLQKVWKYRQPEIEGF